MAYFYDHEIDPREFDNLAGDPRHAAVVAEVKVLLKANHPVSVEGGKAPRPASPKKA